MVDERLLVMAIITLANPKGGSGKTTSVIILATELAHRGYKVTVVDADPEKHVTRWSARVDAVGVSTLPPNITIIPDVDEDTLVDKVFDADEAGADFVLIDPQGQADGVQTQAVSISDLVLVPMVDSTMDQESSHKIIRRIRQEGRKGRKVKHAVLFTQVPRVKTPDGESLDMRAIRGDFERDGVFVFPRKLHHRTVIKKLNRLGGDLYALRQAGLGDVRPAIQTAVELTDGVLAFLAGNDVSNEYGAEEI